MTEIEALQQKIEFLEACLAIERFLNSGKQEVYDKWERALRKYADGYTGKSLAREALGVREYWDAGYGGWFMPIRRAWRRFVEWWATKR